MISMMVMSMMIMMVSMMMMVLVNMMISDDGVGEHDDI